jgi:hypothetical protein
MAEPQFPYAQMSDPELEQALRKLGQELTYPPTPDLAIGVLSRLDRQPSTQIPVARSRRAVWLAAAILIMLLGTLALFPEVRTAIADRLGLGGVRIRWVDEIPTPAPVGTPLLLGRPVSLEEARTAVDFPVFVPTADGFADPAEIYLLGQGEYAMISFVYPAREGLPQSEVIGVGALLTQFRGDVERNLIEKGLQGEDGARETRLDSVTVDGERGFWISGAPHSVFLVCHDDGECREERYRLAGNVLLWERDGVTLRLESALSQEESLTIARSMQPLE